jgi:hypothetical protein
LVKAGPIDYVLAYGAGTSSATISLIAAHITIAGAGSTGCSVTGITGTGLARTVTLNNCTGTGSVNISIAAGTALSTSGENTSAAGPSTSFTADNTGPNAPTGVTLGSVPANFTTNTPTITYTAASDVGGSTVANHQVKIIKTSDSSIISDWANHTSGADIGSLTFVTGTEYSALVRAVDVLGNNGTASTAVNWTAVACPTGYVWVPALASYTTSGFCVAKYVASQSGSDGVSVSGMGPWVALSQPAALTACQQNNTTQGVTNKYDIISNAEWQTVARNAELVGANWSGGTVGNSGGMSQGHSDNSPANALAASSDDVSGNCYGTSQTCSITTWDSQRRTLTLSNGNVVWDFGGNVWQWMKDTNTTNFGASDYMSQVTAANHAATGTVGALTGNATFLFGPSGNYTALSSGQYGGLGYGNLNYSDGHVMRGGAFNIQAGVFSTALTESGGIYWNGTIGFRCVFHP